MNINVVDRRNGVAVFEALGIYLDVMRPFVVQNLPTFPGTADAHALCRDSLPLEMRSAFDKHLLNQGGDLLLTLDVTHIAHVVDKQWMFGFDQRLGNERRFVTKMQDMAKVRNKICHPSDSDITIKQADSAFYCAEQILEKIGRPDAVEQVQQVRDRLHSGCCNECPTSHAASINTEEIEVEVARLKSEMDEISASLAEYRAREIRTPSGVRARLGRLLPKVRFQFSFGVGGESPGPEDTRTHDAEIEAVEPKPVSQPPPQKVRAEKAARASGNGHTSDPDASGSSNGHTVTDDLPRVIRFDRG